jgi:hypothetical protein
LVFFTYFLQSFFFILALIDKLWNQWAILLFPLTFSDKPKQKEYKNILLHHIYNTECNTHSYTKFSLNVNFPMFNSPINVHFTYASVMLKSSRLCFEASSNQSRSVRTGSLMKVNEAKNDITGVVRCNRPWRRLPLYEI